MTAVVTYFAALNLFTLVLAVADKWCVLQGWRRPVSGWVFLALSAIGGSVAAKIGQGVLFHKVLDVEFTNTLNLICLLQIALLSCAWLMLTVDLSLATVSPPAGEERVLPKRFGPGQDGEADGFSAFRS